MGTENLLRQRCSSRLFMYLIMVLLSAGFLSAQAQNQSYQNYIKKYAPIAVEQMRRYGIPASITLAQGLLESAAGQSTLAYTANNHFGIKVGMNWTGPYVLKDDDYKNERFRKYKSAEESYEDHSLFLKNGRRYASLFSLRETDYEGWAKGLKQAGYATNPHYATQLIRIIETYNLAQYDQNHHKHQKEWEADSKASVAGYQFGQCNGVKYLLAKDGDTYQSLARIFGINARKLRKYNDAPKNTTLHAGDIVYLKSKKTKASKKLGYRTHVVKSGESLYSISQAYGIRMKNLYKLNQLAPDHILRVGESIILR
ncbi:MAG: glucosaminidase domain-containing protein [Alloprevotella sp.]|nr:glucosaminidase domain-containing protein [Alloprevotella sp.]